MPLVGTQCDNCSSLPSTSNSSFDFTCKSMNNLTFTFLLAPYDNDAGTNVTDVKLDIKNYSYKVNMSDSQPILAARDKSFDCPSTVEYTALKDFAKVPISFTNLRVQANLPRKRAADRTFSNSDANTSCSSSQNEVNFDAAFYFGLGICVMAGAGVFLFLFQVLKNRANKMRPTYSPIQND